MGQWDGVTKLMEQDLERAAWEGSCVRMKYGLQGENKLTRKPRLSAYPGFSVHGILQASILE